MKTFKATLTAFVIGLLITGCGKTSVSQDGQIPSTNEKVLTLFYVTNTQTTPDAIKIPSCENEYLIKVEKSVWSKPNLENTLNALLNGELMADAGGVTSSLLAEKKITIADFNDPTEPSSTNPFRVAFKVDDLKADPCQASRARMQINETIRAVARVNPFRVTLNGTIQNWECFGNPASYCK